MLNLLRGNQLHLPDAQTLVQFIQKNYPALASAIGLTLLDKKELNPEVIIYGEKKPIKVLDRVGKKYGFDIKTPLWYYISAEAQSEKNGRDSGYKLGTLGSLIVAEVLSSLIYLSKPSILDITNWKSKFITKPTGTNRSNKSNNQDDMHLKFLDLLVQINPEITQE